METKKSKRANLENKKGLFLELGFVIVLSLVLIAFEWSGIKKANTELILAPGENDPEDIIVNTIQDKKPPLPKQPEVPVFILMKNNTEFEEEIFNINFEDDPWDLLEIDYPDEPDNNEALPFFKVEESPSFRNGDLNSFNKYIQSKLKYPLEAINLELSGRVYVQFVVDKNGNVTDIQVLRGIDPILDNQVIEVMENSPKWKPGKQRGMAVNVRYTMSVLFTFKN